jgi:hypothetical protein
MIVETRLSLMMCTVIGTLTQCSISSAKLFAMASTASVTLVGEMFLDTCGTAMAGVGCHGTALGFKQVNPSRPLQQLSVAGDSTAKPCQGIEGGGGIAETVERLVVLSSPCRPHAQGKLVWDRGVLIGVLVTSSKLQVSNQFSDVSEHPSVEAWLSGLEHGTSNGRVLLGDVTSVTDSRPTPGILVTGEILVLEDVTSVTDSRPTPGIPVTEKVLLLVTSVTDSRPTPGILVTGEEKERLCAP